MKGLLTHADSPYIRGIGFLYLRLTCPPQKLWDWFHPYLDDEEEIILKQKGRPMAMGKFVKSLITDQKFFSILFPRIPVPFMRSLEKNLEEFDNSKKRDMRMNRDHRSIDKNRREDYDGEYYRHERRDRRSRSRDSKRKRSRDRNSYGRSERKRRRSRSRSPHRSNRSIERKRRRSRSRSSDRHKRRELSPSVTAKFSTSKPQGKVDMKQLQDLYGNAAEEDVKKPDSKKTEDSTDTFRIGFQKK
eukprot:TRINITY_DN841_c0_g1_i1.p1 TRINITY_DN841_c0_g1~~TRINITY_DN841_c0_g1_i1.p1  ORF type:complete len:245 (-),score=37.22 TRINITY_DN841_c0_g1_i1:21-755(-)